MTAAEQAVARGLSRAAVPVVFQQGAVQKLGAAIMSAVSGSVKSIRQSGAGQIAGPALGAVSAKVKEAVAGAQKFGTAIGKLPGKLNPAEKVLSSVGNTMGGKVATAARGLLSKLGLAKPAATPATAVPAVRPADQGPRRTLAQRLTGAPTAKEANFKTQQMLRVGAEGFAFGGLSGGIRGLLGGAIAAGGPLTAVGLALTAAGTVAKEAKDAFFGLAAAADPTTIKLLDDAWQVLAGTIGQYLSPVVDVITASVLTLADILKEAFGPSLDNIVPIVTAALIPVIAELGGWLTKLASASAHLASVLDQVVANILDFAAKLPGVRDAFNFAGVDPDSLHRGADAMRQLSQIAGTFSDSIGKFDAAHIQDLLAKNFEQVGKDKQLEQGKLNGAPSFKGIGDIWKTVQLRSFQTNMDTKKIALAQKGNDLHELTNGLIRQLLGRPAVITK